MDGNWCCSGRPSSDTFHTRHTCENVSAATICFKLMWNLCRVHRMTWLAERGNSNLDLWVKRKRCHFWLSNSTKMSTGLYNSLCKMCGNLSFAIAAYNFLYLYRLGATWNTVTRTIWVINTIDILPQPQRHCILFLLAMIFSTQRSQQRFDYFSFLFFFNFHSIFLVHSEKRRGGQKKLL